MTLQMAQLAVIYDAPFVLTTLSVSCITSWVVNMIIFSFTKSLLKAGVWMSGDVYQDLH
jgi:hypothetical protein